MSDLSARQAELEELRQRQIANSNAKALDEKGSIPLNMLDWQAQQRALKAADREMKNQAAATLHSFQNTTVEQSTLSALQKEEREKKRMSQEQLHQYRAAFTGTPGRNTQRRSTEHADGVESSTDVMAGINVSDAIANLNQQRTEDEFIVGGREHLTNVSSHKEDTSSPFDFSDTNDKLAESETTADSMVLVESPHDMPHDLLPPVPDLIHEDHVTDQEDDDDDGEGDDLFDPIDAGPDGIVLVHEPKHDFDEWVSVTQPADDLDHMTMKHSNRDVHHSVIPVSVPVDFSFALVSLDQPPNVDKYLRAAAFVVGVQDLPVLKSMTCTGPIAERPGAFKYMVTCSLPVKLPGHSQDAAQLHVLGLLRAAIKDRSFESIANSN